MINWRGLEMPITVYESLPKGTFNKKKKSFIVNRNQDLHQQIRPLRILILNIMPAKVETEIQLLRLLENSFLPLSIDFIHPISHDSKNTAKEYLQHFYKTFDQVKSETYDGMIITGAPVETIDFEAVDYWDEMKAIMDWSRTNVNSTLHICWGAMAALYYHYGIPKYLLDQKLSGIFTNQIEPGSLQPLLQNFKTDFYMPHSRFSEVRRSDIESHPELEILATSKEAGQAIAASKDGRQIFIQGHFEYDSLALSKEYERDSNLGKCFEIPKNFYPGNDPEAIPLIYWRNHSNLLMSNWLRYYVNRTEPKEIREMKFLQLEAGRVNSPLAAIRE